MSEEEKTIENLRKNKGVSFAEAEIILNLIEKQQKEIEELKEKNKELTDEYMIQKYLINPDFLKDYISKDKIKDKIKELDIEIQQCQYEDDDIEEYKNDMKKEKSRFLRDRKILQELLEENNEM